MNHHGMPPQGMPNQGMPPPMGQMPGEAPPGVSNSHSRTVFVGNIPYDADDNQIKALLKLVGPFHTFRLKHDKESEKPKGYGFCEYKDMDIASSALRNLNQYELNGRQLRVDFASDNKNGTNLKDEEVKYRDIADIYNQETWEPYQISDCTSVQDIMKNLSLGQKEFLLNAIKDIVEKSEEHEQAIEKILDKDPEL
eukprot:CAMPEP_0197009630 /NCGR_PEP_ID=MMETSP1380-20130617/50904_1 /TAXON_ID=5936 /ORGANISM="Euplotes crassus, Strain CT5" /LENGTH=195 /DNA_ID=CAMNT_0042431015 /DNA_START=16 /DNA_END=603 /DNA_ORIENTATION=+